MGRRFRVLAAVGLVLVTSLWTATGALAYTYLGACNSVTNYTWDIVDYSVTNLAGAEMDQYLVPDSPTWATCSYNGSGTFGHVAELDSVQGGGSGEITQVGIVKFVSSSGTSWMFVWTPHDNTDGVLADAKSLFGFDPVYRHSYWFHVQSVYVGPYYVWEYCIKDLYTSHQACWDDSGASWHTTGSTGFDWFGGETVDYNDSMGGHTETQQFKSYAVRGKTSVWLGYLSDSQLTNDCVQWNYNRTIVNCNVQDVGTSPGFFIWTQ